LKFGLSVPSFIVKSRTAQAVRAGPACHDEVTADVVLPTVTLDCINGTTAPTDLYVQAGEELALFRAATSRPAIQGEDDDSAALIVLAPARGRDTCPGYSVEALTLSPRI